MYEIYTYLPVSLLISAIVTRLLLVEYIAITPSLAVLDA